MTEQLTAELERIVNDRLSGQVKGFKLILDTHGFVLLGTARSYYAKQMAQQLVMEVTEVRIMANQIEVLHGEQS